jgi:hypothetical protein
MKRAGFLVPLLAAAAGACVITFTPARDTGVVGETLRFKVLVANIHVPCLIGIDATTFESQRLHLAHMDSTWVKLSATRFEKGLSVVLDSAGTGSIGVKRVCEIRTSTGGASVLINPKPKPKPRPEPKTEPAKPRNLWLDWLWGGSSDLPFFLQPVSATR